MEPRGAQGDAGIGRRQGTMGYGDYSHEAHQAMTTARAALPMEQVFSGRVCDPRMNPLGVKLRESRDSADHPESVAIVFALDVSGSMGAIPHGLATATMPRFMQSVLEATPHPQVMFMAFGNAWADGSPLQVGQFESEAALIDQWLSAIHIEGGGGGQGESYELAMYFGARHIAMDCFEKRQKKGYFFITGDENPMFVVDPGQARRILGDELPAPIEATDVLIELQKQFHVFFLVPDRVRAADPHCLPVWRHLLGEAAVVLESPDDTALACALLVAITEGLTPDAAGAARFLSEKLGCDDATRERLLGTVQPYLQALAQGPLGPPRRLVRVAPDPSKQG